MPLLADRRTTPTDLHRSGLLNGAAAFAWWGFVFPLLLVAVNWQVARMGYVGTGAASRWDWSLEFLAHCAIWSLATCSVLLTLLGRWGEVRTLVRSRRSVALLAVTAALILGNWLGFVYGATTGRLSQVSLGYYINPLFSVVLGVFVLGERLRRLQLFALALATAGVTWETYRLGELPWISLLVAFAFGLYGVFRKQINAAAIPGLAMETALLLPLALGYLLYRETLGPAPAFGRDTLVTVLIILSGIGTAAPLIWFANAAKRLPLSSVAFLQFIVPTGQLLVALTLNGETLPPAAIITFALIWLGVAAFVWDLRTTSIRSRESMRMASLTEF